MQIDEKALTIALATYFENEYDTFQIAAKDLIKNYLEAAKTEQPVQETAIDAIAKMRCDRQHDELRRNGGAGWLWKDLQESTREALRQKIRDDVSEYRQYGILGSPKREVVEVPDMDVEVAIAEAIQLMPRDHAYEDKGAPVLQYLKKLGYRII